MERNSGKPACASCKHQRKKCTEKCILAPLFPASKYREFQAVHKVFGVSNVMKIVKNLKEEDRKRAVNSLIWEAICRQNDPILGPYAEYAKIYEELKLYKSFQVSAQNGMVYKPTPNFGGWNSSNNKSVGVFNRDKYISDNGNDSNIANLSPFSLSTENNHLREEKDAGSVILLPPQHNSINDFNYQYYLPGQFSSSEVKHIETILWEGSS